MKDSVKALVAARSGSQRVKGKNIRPFAGSSLLAIKVNQLMRIKEIDGVVVNSNDDEILAVAKSLGCETVKRDNYYATDYVSPTELFVNAAENFDGDIVVFANCTNPLLKDSTVSEAIKKYFEVCNENDSLNTVHQVKEFLFRDGKPINYDLSHPPRSQDLPEIISLNFAINILSRSNMIKCRNVVGHNPFFFDIGRLEATDIDDQLDFDFAEYCYKSNILRLSEPGSEIKESLMR